MLIQTIPSFVGIAAFYTMRSIISAVIPGSAAKVLIFDLRRRRHCQQYVHTQGYIDSISMELDDAARIDGWKLASLPLVIMPIVRPMLAYVVVLSDLSSTICCRAFYLATRSNIRWRPTLYTLISTSATCISRYLLRAYADGAAIIILFIALQNQRNIWTCQRCGQGLEDTMKNRSD